MCSSFKVVTSAAVLLLLLLLCRRALAILPTADAAREGALLLPAAVAAPGECGESNAASTAATAELTSISSAAGISGVAAVISSKDPAKASIEMGLLIGSVTLGLTALLLAEADAGRMVRTGDAFGRGGIDDNVVSEAVPKGAAAPEESRSAPFFPPRLPRRSKEGSWPYALSLRCDALEGRGMETTPAMCPPSAVSVLTLLLPALTRGGCPLADADVDATRGSGALLLLLFAAICSARSRCRCPFPLFADPPAESPSGPLAPPPEAIDV